MFDAIWSYLTSYWWIIPIAALAYLAYRWWKGAKEHPLKPVIRAEVERAAFLERMQQNVATDYDWFVQAGKRRLFISRFQASIFPEKKREFRKEQDGSQKIVWTDTGKDIRTFEFVGKKPLLPQLGFFFGRVEGFVVLADNCYIDPARPREIVFKSGKTMWKKTGIFYDNDMNPNMVEYFSRNFTAQTDYDNLLSEYYAASQEESVIDREHGHETLSDHLEIERIKEERRKKQLTPGRS